MPERPPRKSYVYADATDDLVFKGGYILDIYNMITDTMLHFKAFITDYAENFDAEYSENRVYGRMDPIYNFKHTTRTISLGFDLPASSANEARWNMTKCANMLSMLYPAYADNGGGGATALKSPPMFRLRFANFILSNKLPKSLVYVKNSELPYSAVGISNPASLQHMGGKIFRDGRSMDARDAEIADYSPPSSGDGPSNSAISGLPGIIRSLTYSPDTEAGFFDTSPGVLYPKLIKLNFEYNVLHEHSMGWQKVRRGKKSFGLEFRNNVDPKTGQMKANAKATRDYPFYGVGRAAFSTENQSTVIGAVPSTPDTLPDPNIGALKNQKNAVEKKKARKKGSGKRSAKGIRQALT